MRVHRSVVRQGTLLSRRTVRCLSSAAGPLPHPPPDTMADEEWREATGCMELPPVLRQRALGLLRSGAAKERLGLAKMVARHRPVRTKHDDGLPFTRAMYSGERTPAGDAGAGLALVAERLPAFYGSALRPLIELRKRVPDFVPRTVLLHGGGIGAAAFAVRHAWPDHRPQILAVEPHAELSRIGQELTAGMIGLTWQARRTPAGGAASRDQAKPARPRTSIALGELHLDAPSHSAPAAKSQDLGSWSAGPVEDAAASSGSADAGRDAGDGSQAPAAVSTQGWDLVLCSFAFAEKETGDAAAVEKEVWRLWTECTGIMVVVEAGTPRGFQTVARIREQILAREMGDCKVLAPCPHDGQCPILTSSEKATKWCHFSQRMGVPSFQKAAERGPHAKKKAYADWKFSFVALGRKRLLPAPPKQPDGAGFVNWGRVLRWPMRRKGHVILDLCNAEGRIERRVVARSHGHEGGYRRARQVKWGDVFEFSKASKNDREGEAGSRRQRLARDHA